MLSAFYFHPTTIVSTLTLSLLCGCQPDTDKNDLAAGWPQDCVGTLQIKLPDKADVSAQSISTVISDIKIASNWPRSSFQDGQVDDQSLFCIHGCLLISHPTDDENTKKAVSVFYESRKAAEARIRKNSQTPETARAQLSNIDDPDNNVFGWRTNRSYFALKLSERTVASWSIEFSADSKDAQNSNKFFEEFSRIEFRPFGTIPKRNGLCLPYIFIPTNTNYRRNISTTYRMKSQPDITIWLEDNYSEPEDQNTHHFERNARQEIDKFWSILYRGHKAYRYLSIESVTIAEMPGKASSVELVRSDGSIDYGYFASVYDKTAANNGQAHARIFIIRDANHATTKQIPPLGKRDFMALAQSISTNVRRISPERH